MADPMAMEEFLKAMKPQGFDDAINLQLQQADWLRSGGAPQMRSAGRVTRAPHWLELVGGLARQKAGADALQEARKLQAQKQQAQFERNKALVQSLNAPPSTNPDPLQAATENAHAYDNAAIAAGLSGDPALARAVAQAAQNRQARYKPTVSNQGVTIPASGEFIENPVYKQERDDARAQQKALADERAAERKSALAQTLAQQRQIAGMLEQGRNDRAAASNALRESLLAITGARQADATAAREERDTNTNIQKLSAFADKKQVPRLMENGRALITAMNKAGKGDVPGFTATDMIKATVPGGERFLTPEALGNISAYKGITNALMKADAGLNQTQQETLRQQMETFDRPTTSSSTRVTILRKHILPLLEVSRAAVLGSADQKTRDTYRSRQKETGGDAAWMDPLDLSEQMSDDDLINKYLPKKGK